jgi:NAD+ synthase
MDIKPEDPKQTTEALQAFLKKTFATAGFSKAVIGLSGGLDSATSLFLAVGALGETNVFPVLLPYGALSTQSTIDAMGVIEKARIPIGNITRIDIKNAADLLMQAGGCGFDNVRRGNIMARIRMTVLFDQAKKRNALVVGTENKSEYLLGYFTRYGDEASDVEPLMGLYKTQVFALAKRVGVPEHIITKAPSADLWFDQTDEKELGFTYKEADEIMALLYDEKKTVEEVVGAGFDRELVENVKARVSRNAYKHKVPYTQ